MSIASRLEFLLIPFKAQTIFTGRVNGTLTDPYMSIPYDGSSVTSNPLAGNTVWFGSTAGARDRGVLRLRSWNGSNQISVAENDDVTQYVQDNDFITIKQEWRLWPIYLRAVQHGTNVTIFQDYNVSWQRQTIDWKPVAVAGPPAVSEFNGTNFTAKFVGDRSFAVASGETITAWLWTAPGSVEGTSSSQGTEASPVTFTWTSAGQKLVYLRVTDSNGNTHTNYTWAFGYNPNTPASVAYTDFDAFNDNLDFEQGGGSCSFNVHNDATITDFPAECMVILASRGSQTTPTGYWPFRTNVHFVGYVVGKSVRQNPTSGDVSFRATTIDGLMRNLTAFPASLTYKNSPNNWTTAANLTVDRAASYLWHYHSTLSLMTSIIPSNYSGLIQRQDFGPSSLYDQLQSELMASILGKVVSNHQSVLYHEIDYQMMLNAERAAVTTRKTLHKGVWVDDVNIEERDNYEWPTNQVKMSGVYYPGGSIEDVCPSFSEAPGNAPKVYGKERNYDRLIITSQSALNIRCGRALAKDIQDYPTVDMRFINDGSFTTVPQEIFPTRIEAGDNERGIAFSTSVLPRRISRNYDNYNGFIDVSVGFEPVTDGPPGVTVDLPCGPPEQKLGSREVPLERQETGDCILSPFSPQIFDGGSATVDDVVIEAISATKSIVAWTDLVDGNKGKCRVIDASTEPPTLGAIITFEAGSTGQNIALSADPNSDTKCLIVWKTGNVALTNVNILTESAGALSLGTGDTFGSGANFQLLSTEQTMVSSTKAFLTLADATTGAGRGIVATISGTTVTIESQANLNGTDTDTVLTSTRLDDTHVFLVLTGSVLAFSAVVITVGATTFTFNTELNLTLTITGLGALGSGAFSASKAIYAENTNYLIFDISGATINGVNVTARPITAEGPRLAILSSTQFIEVWEAASTILVQTGTVTAFGVDQDNNLITIETNDDSKPHPLIAANSSTRATVAYALAGAGVGYDVVVNLEC